MHRSRLLEETISDYAFIQQFFTSMHPRIGQDVAAQYTGDQDIHIVIAMAQKLDSIHRSTGAYGKERYEKHSTDTTHKKQEQKPKRKVQYKGKKRHQ